MDKILDPFNISAPSAGIKYWLPYSVQVVKPDFMMSPFISCDPAPPILTMRQIIWHFYWVIIKSGVYGQDSETKRLHEYLRYNIDKILKPQGDPLTGSR